MCRFDGNPRPSTHWTFVGFDGYASNISQSENFKFVFNGLQIKEVKKQNEGWYTCIGRNQVGMLNEKAFLHVLGKHILLCFHGVYWSVPNFLLTSTMSTHKL